ncbi:uncharacterized protein LOC128240745 [Mya arenaria]|uniref:uncharacterized protein LOC128240745 n=1 Tax=Mya arenaria TaxID=6604 RepID=UPI0022DF450F|nr:uncharacterized protein LOC128240745 [Mya arenaria]
MDVVRNKEDFLDENELVLAAQNGLVTELYQTQMEAARYLHLGMLKLWNHPKVAKDVRMSATTTRMLHQNTVGLMTKFKTTSQLVVQKIIPIILIGVEKKDEAIITASLKKIADFASDMQTETTKMKDRYNEVVHKVNGSIGDIETENHDIRESTKEKQCQIELEKGRREETERTVKMLEKDVEEQSTELKALEKEGKEARAELVATAGSMGKRKESSKGKDFLKDTFNPKTVTGGTAGQALKVVEAGLALADDIFQHIKQGKEYALKKDAHATIEKATQERSQELLKRKREMQEQRERRLQQIHTIKMLNMKIDAGIGDMENLKEAILHLGKVQSILSKLSEFWEKMSNVIKVLQANDDINDLHLLTMKYDPSDIREAIEESKTYWKMFGTICHGYVSSSQKEIGPMYAFLEKPLDSLSPAERMEKTKKLIDSIEEDINQTYPAIECAT